MVEMCYKTHTTTVNPIVDWADAEVWEFIREYNVPYCKLYDEGYKRLGCIGCPMSTRQAEELERYPKYKKLYLIAFENMLKRLDNDKLITTWKTPQGVMNWWLGL
jgi:phosphoadenosine phosphosulfate reductase